MKNILTVKCATEKLFRTFSGGFLPQIKKEIEEERKKDSSVDYSVEYPDKMSMIITITGTDETVKKTYAENKKELKSMKTKIYLKAFRTKMINELIE